jgi:hypothetical protein
LRAPKRAKRIITTAIRFLSKSSALLVPWGISRPAAFKFKLTLPKYGPDKSAQPRKTQHLSIAEKGVRGKF